MTDASSGRNWSLARSPEEQEGPWWGGRRMIILSMKCSYEGGGSDVPSTQNTSDTEGPPIYPASKLVGEDRFHFSAKHH